MRCRSSRSAGLDATPGQRTVVIAMGTPGLATRVLPEHVGSCWTYGGNGVAPGQVTVDRLRDEFRVGRVGASTPVYAVVGRPIGHSVSPAMHNAAFAATRRRRRLHPVRGVGLRRLPRARRRARHRRRQRDRAVQGRRGADGGGRAARSTRCGARDGGWDGTNTDVEGFLAPLAGADARGPACRGPRRRRRRRARSSRGLVSRGARVSVHARRPEAAQALADARAAWRRARGRVPRGSWDLLVNTTPVGTHPDVDRSPVDAGTARRARRRARLRPRLQPAADAAAARRRGRRLRAPSTASTCWSRRPSASSRGGPA